MKIAKLIPVLALLALPAAAGAQDFVQRDAAGRRTGTIEQSGNDFIRRDASGRRIETYESDGRGGYVIRDAGGRRTGTLEKR